MSTYLAPRHHTRPISSTVSQGISSVYLYMAPGHTHRVSTHTKKKKKKKKKKPSRHLAQFLADMIWGCEWLSLIPRLFFPLVSYPGHAGGEAFYPPLCTRQTKKKNAGNETTTLVQLLCHKKNCRKKKEQFLNYPPLSKRAPRILLQPQ